MGTNLGLMYLVEELGKAWSRCCHSVHLSGRMCLSVPGGTASPTSRPELAKTALDVAEHPTQHPGETFLPAPLPEPFLTLTFEALGQGKSKPSH